MLLFRLGLFFDMNHFIFIQDNFSNVKKKFISTNYIIWSKGELSKLKIILNGFEKNFEILFCRKKKA